LRRANLVLYWRVLYLPYWAIYLSYYYVVAQSEGSCRQTLFVSKAADAFYDSDKLYHIDGHHELAIQDCTEAIRLDPQYAIVYRGRGVVYSDLGQHQRSILDYDEAIHLNPQYARAYYNRGVAYEKLGQQELADRDFAKAKELTPATAPTP